MKANIGSIDKTVRILIAALVLVLYFTNIISGILAIVLFIVAGILLVTAFINFCPIWHFLGISTRKKSIQS
jgi:zinc transporter ZupT